jgi:hypothetical protein
MTKTSKFSELKKGDYFRFEGKRKVYFFDGGGKVRGYKYTAFDDINNTLITKTDRVVEVGFNF